MNIEQANEQLRNDPALADVRARYEAAAATSAPPSAPAPSAPPASTTNPDLAAQRAELRDHLLGEGLTDRERAEGLHLLEASYGKTTPPPAAPDPLTGSDSTEPLVADEFAAAPNTSANLTITMPPESAAEGYSLNEPAVHAFIATSQTLGLAPKVMEKLLQFDAATTWEDLDPDARPNPGELEAAQRILEVLPPSLRAHVTDRGHLQRPEFVSLLARMGSRLRTLSADRRSEIRNQIARAFHERRR